MSRITDFGEAATAVGFDIPKSDLYPLHWGYLFIQPSVELGPSTPRTATAIYDVQQNTVEVTVGPLSFWPAGALREGNQVSIGGRTGWLSTDKYSVYFSLAFSQSDSFGEIWLEIVAPPGAEPLLESVVASLKLPAR